MTTDQLVAPGRLLSLVAIQQTYMFLNLWILVSILQQAAQ